MCGETNHCCCCVSVKNGALILGFFTLLALLQEIDSFVPLRLAINGVAAGAFILMLLDDTKQKRQLFFYSYMIASLIQYCTGVYMAFDKVGDKEPWKQACDDLYKQGKMQ